VISFKKKKQSYITSRSEHHHHNNNTSNKTLHRLSLGEKLKGATKSCTVVPRQKSRPAASLSDNSNSSATGKQPYTAHAWPRSLDSSLASEESLVTTSAHPTWTLNAWGPRHIHLKMYGDQAARHTRHSSKDPCHWNHTESITYTTPKSRSPQHHAHRSKTADTHDSSAPSH
jgi:hypothetical protein